MAADIASLGDTIRPALFQKVTEERLRFAAHHDYLTQLSNRLMFQDCLRKTIAGTRSTDRGFAVLCLDLDGFKQINDTCGHEIGDSLLVEVAQRLRDNVRETDTVSRMGGDEFAIIQPLGNQPTAAISLAKRLIDALTAALQPGGSPGDDRRLHRHRPLSATWRQRRSVAAARGPCALRREERRTEDLSALRSGNGGQRSGDRSWSNRTCGMRSAEATFHWRISPSAKASR